MKNILFTAFMAALFVTTAQANPPSAIKHRSSNGASLRPQVQAPLSVAQAELRQIRRDSDRLRARLVEAQRNAVKAQVQLRQAQLERDLAQTQAKVAQIQLQAQRQKLAELKAQQGKLLESYQ